jgi:hypothetical protein
MYISPFTTTLVRVGVQTSAGRAIVVGDGEGGKGEGEGPERARALLVAVCSKQLKRTLVPFDSIDILKYGAQTVYLNISCSFGLQEEIFRCIL